MKKILSKICWLLAVIIAIAVLTLLFTGIIQAAMSVIWSNISDSTLYSVSGTLGSGVVAVALWLVIRNNKRLGFYNCNHPRDVAWTATFIIFTIATCRIVLPGLWAYGAYALSVAPSEIGNAPINSLWQMISFGVVFAPIIEELLFRKDIFSLLLKRFSVTWTIGLSSLIFAAIHGYNAEGFVSCLLAGSLFSILMARTGSLMLCITAHMLCNLESLVYNQLESHGSCLIITLGDHTTYSLYILAIGVMLMFVCAMFLIKSKRISSQPLLVK